MAQGGANFFVRLARHSRWAVPLGLALACLTGPIAAQASPEPPKDARDTPSPRLVEIDGRAWPAAVEAIEFELDQAGYVVVHGPTDSNAALVLGVHRDETGWELRLTESPGDGLWTASGGPQDPPHVAGVHAVELVYAYAATRTVPSSGEVETTAAPEPVAPIPETKPTAAAVVEPATAPPIEPSSRRWALDVTVTASSLGSLGGRLGVRRQWPRFELGMTASGGYYSVEQEQETADTRTSISGRGFWGFGPAAAYVIRGGHRLRPHVGVDVPLIFPVVASSHALFGQTGSLGASNGNATTVGVLCIPGLHAGVEVDVAPRLAFRASLRGGPVISLNTVNLSGGSTLQIPPLALTGAAGLAF